MNGHGGARPGAGRKRKADKYESEIAACERRIADRLPQRLDALEYLADGGYEQIEEVWEPAGLIQVTREVITDDGRSVNVKELAFPHLPPEQLVCVQRRRSIAAPDRAANMYLVDRILGKTTTRVDLDADPDGRIEITAQAMSDAAKELAEWRRQMSVQLSSLPSVPPTLPT